MKIRVNTEEREVPTDTTLASLLRDIPAGGTATAVNGKFIAKDARDCTLLHEGDEVTIITAAYGG